MSMFGRDGHEFTSRPVPPPDNRAYPAPQSSQRRRSLPLFVSIAGILIWTVFAFAGYLMLDVVLAWAAGSGDAVLAAGKNAGSLVGAGKEVGVVMESISSSGLLQQIVGLFRMLLVPSMMLIWFVGMLVLLILPKFFGRLTALLASRRH